jgi:hypothetical protein
MNYYPPFLGFLLSLGMTVECHHHEQLFSTEMGDHKIFCPGWPGTAIFSMAWDDNVHNCTPAFGCDGVL